MKIDMMLTFEYPEADRLVQAEIVDVAPHLWGTFAVHRLAFRRRWWRVSHVETGAGAGPMKPTKDSAIRSARALLREKTQETLDEGILKNMALRPDVYGQSPLQVTEEKP